MIKLEVDEERKFVNKCAEFGCKAIKFVDGSSRNAPDRMVYCPGGRVIFFEFKAKGKRPRRGQIKYQAGLKSMGFTCYVVYTAEQAINYLKDFLCL